MALHVEQVYNNLNDLLTDICTFLSVKSNYDKLSPAARKKADELLDRSKNQLQEIEIIVSNNPVEYDGAYVDMDRKPKPPSGLPTPIDDNICEIYSSVEENENVSKNFDEKNPFATFPAKDLLLTGMKFGNLSIKVKIFLSFEKMRRVYAGIHENWLLLYSSEKDLKPFQSLHLKFYKAQSVQSKFDREFELVSTEHKKHYIFLALTHKDMLQWITHINQSYESLNLPSPILSEKNLEYRDKSYETGNENDEIYHDIESITYKNEKVETRVMEDKSGHRRPPNLPVRRTMFKAVPLPPIPPPYIENSSNSQNFYMKPTDTFESNSFSEEEEEDVIYEPFISPTDVRKNSTQSPIKENDNKEPENDKTERHYCPPDFKTKSPTAVINNSFLFKLPLREKPKILPKINTQKPSNK